MKDVIDCPNCGGNAASTDANTYSCDTCGHRLTDGVWEPDPEREPLTPAIVENLIRKFVEFVTFPSLEDNRPRLQTVEITNHSSNDYWRDSTPEEREKLVADFLASRGN